jgi:hypothetical protein
MELLEFMLMMAGFVLSGVFFYYAKGLKSLLGFLSQAEAFVILHKNDFPEEFKGLYEDLLHFIEEAKMCLADGKLSMSEMVHLYKDGMALFDEAKGILESFKK